MKASTTIRMVGGTWYIRVPPSFAQHLGLKEEPEDAIVEGEIQDEVGKHGNYISSWKIPQKKER